MKEEPKQSAVAPITPAAPIVDESVKDARAVLEKNKQLLNELRAVKEEASSLKTWKVDVELKEKEQAGQYSEVIAALRDENKLLKETRESDKKAASFSKFTTQIKALAQEQGCVNSDALMKLMTKDQMASVEVDDNFNVNMDDTNRLLEALKTEHDYLFTGKKLNINNIAGGFKATPQKEFKNMSSQEMRDAILNG